MPKESKINPFDMPSDESSSVCSHSFVRSGRLTIDGTRFLVSQLFAEISDNERISDIANEYDINVEKLKEAFISFAIFFNDDDTANVFLEWKERNKNKLRDIKCG